MQETIEKLNNSYWKPTPKKLRKIGDALLLIGTTITGISAFTMPPWVTLSATICTLVGKLITNCFSE
jgi:hypothetical protein